jgi:CRISPR/Cas system-associated endoribonuclease Cas2
MMVVFSTNLNPKDLADEAFLRRIQTKVLVGDITPEVFDQIFRQVVDTNKIPCDPNTAEYLREACIRAGATTLRACYPSDIYKLVRAISEYDGRPVRITKPNIDHAVSLYFAKDPDVR